MTVRVVFIDKGGKEKTLDRLLLIDDLTKAVVRISYAHHEIHEGCSFTMSCVDETLADAETLIVAFKTMSRDERVHLFIEFSTLVGGYAELWESPTWTTNTGTTTPIINRKRTGSPSVSILLEDKTATPSFTRTGNVLVNPTGLNTGSATSLSKQYAWGERGKIGALGQRDENEFILNSDTTYAVVFTAIGASNKAQLILHWYEH